jgi:type I restriction enzyme S subunit
MINKTNTPSLRFPQFSGNWEIKKLGEVAKFFSGGTPLTTVKDYFNGDIPFIRSGEINSDFTEQYISEMGLKNSSAKIINKGDLLYALYGATSGEVGISKINGAINQAILCIRSSQNVIFLMNYLRFNKEIILKTFLQGGQGNLSAEIIKNLEISFPTLPEQGKIAGFLTVVDEKLQALKKKKALLEEYKKGIMQRIFSGKLRFKDAYGQPYPDWEVRKLGEVAKIYDGTHQTPNYQESGIPFYSVEQLTSNNFVNTKFVSLEVYINESKRVKIENGDILMTRIGDIGTSRLIDWDVKASFYVSIVLIKTKNLILSKYLHFFISSDFFQNELWNRTIHVAFPKKINLGEIGECNVKFPTLPEQEKIAEFLGAIDAKIAALQSQLDKTMEWKKGLLQGMFC